MTDLSVTVPCTVAVNCNVPPVVAEVVAGETVTEVTTGVGGGLLGAAVILTMAEADFVASALLVAVTVAVPGLAGAV